MWNYRGRKRPPFAVEPGPDQESVWDYPRPPALVKDDRLVTVGEGDASLARSERARRVLETASPPTFYLPPEDVEVSRLVPTDGASFCEWKGMARYWALADDQQGLAVAWSYDDPTPSFRELKDHFAFYPGRVPCFVSAERVRPQPGGFYGGWVTDEIVGPVKGEPGTGGW